MIIPYQYMWNCLMIFFQTLEQLTIARILCSTKHDVGTVQGQSCICFFAVEWTLFIRLSWWVDSGTSCSRWQQSTASLRGSLLPDWPFSSVFSTIGGTSNFCIGAVWQWEASSFWSFFISYRCVHRLLRAKMCLSESLEACACMHAYTED